MIKYSTNVKDMSAGRLNDLLSSVGWLRRDKGVWKKIIEKPGYFIAAFDNDKCVGFARAFDDGRIWAIVCDLMVHPDYRKQGIAVKIMKRVKKWAVGKKFRTLRLFASIKEDPGLKKFYKKLGYEEMDNAMRSTEMPW